MRSGRLIAPLLPSNVGRRGHPFGDDRRVEPGQAGRVALGGEVRIVHGHGSGRLRDALRGAGYVSVRFGSHSGETGAAAVLLDGRLVIEVDENLS
mgnify:CR=1 FL=1